MSTQSDIPTTVCVLTPPGEGGIAVIEVRGPRAVEIVDAFFHSPRGLRIAEAPPGKLLYGNLVRDGETLDEVVVARVAQGQQGVLEINCHGGAVASSRVVDALVSAGARMTTAAERLDLMRKSGTLDAIAAEAAARIPRAPTLLAATVLLDQFRGALGRGVRDIAKRAKALANPCGGSAEHPLALQEGGTPMTMPAGSPDSPVTEIAEELESLLATARYGRGLIEPCRVVVTGRPNVGKSTLSNALLRFERMIVHTVPGTTRDTVEDLFSVVGVPFVLVDTAGIRDARDEIEREGVARARAAALEADVTVMVLDGSESLTEEDRALLREPAARPRVIALNKWDLPLRADMNEIPEQTRELLVRVAARTGKGIEELERRILDAAYPTRPEPGTAVIFTVRQQECLTEALAAARADDAEGVSRALDSLLHASD